MMPVPSWTSRFHKFSFQRLSALSFTQFDKVIVMDNDMALRANIDDLASDGARAPGMVFHTATVLPKKARRAPIGGCPRATRLRTRPHVLAREKR